MDWSSCLDKLTGTPSLNCIPVVFGNVVKAALMFAGVVAVFLIIISGIKFINSGGDPKQVEGARKTMTYAIIGLVVVLSSFFIVDVIAKSTGAECILNFGFAGCQ